ncbi:MAG: hypothetical protein KAJ81_06340, partial [Candidatus Latescibacteria bacterium]|nr:hypothetical protein [Candidatus Latescibacterota bacterium]
SKVVLSLRAKLRPFVCKWLTRPRSAPLAESMPGHKRPGSVSGLGPSCLTARFIARREQREPAS